ncbi:MAG: leucine-rich repeat domain-containing protein [Bacteroidales bacterium]|nr:leucine-rich repeat domain-containing protein [Bacteroidales bacterium]
MNRIVTFLASTFISALGAVATSPDGVFTYTFSSGSSPIAMITGYAREYTDAQLVIPDEVTLNGVTYTVTTASGLDGNPYITEVSIGKNLKSCMTFRNCSSLTRFAVDSDNPYIMVLDDAWLCQNYQPKGTPYLWTLAAGAATGDVTIPSSIVNIYDGAFNGCDIDCLTFTSCVVSASSLIQAAGIYDANHDYLGWEVLGTIRQYALADNLTQWANGKKYFIEGEALYGCYYNGLTTSVSLISMPMSTTRTELIISDSCDRIGAFALGAVGSLRNLVIPSSVTLMSEYTFAYDRNHYSSHLKNIVIGAGLKEVYLPTTANTIATVHCKSTTPPDVYGIIFWESETELEAGGVDHLYVPEEGYEAYSSHKSWGLIPEIAIYDIEGPGIGSSSSDTGTTVTWHASNVQDTDYYTVRAFGDASLEQLVEEQTVNLGARNAQATSCAFQNLEPYTDYWVTIEGIDYDGQPCYFDYLAIHTGSTSSIPLVPEDTTSASTPNDSPSYYDLSGRRLPHPIPGINLVLTPTGTYLKRLNR